MIENYQEVLTNRVPFDVAEREFKTSFYITKYLSSRDVMPMIPYSPSIFGKSNEARKKHQY